MVIDRRTPRRRAADRLRLVALVAVVGCCAGVVGLREATRGSDDATTVLAIGVPVSVVAAATCLAASLWAGRRGSRDDGPGMGGPVGLLAAGVLLGLAGALLALPWVG